MTTLSSGAKWKGIGRPPAGVTLQDRLLHGATMTNRNGCWIWTRTRREGYGRLKIGKALVQAHRAAYEVWVGPIPEGLQLDHLCRNPACINPAHLEPVTHTENMRRGATKGGVLGPPPVTHCKHGHEFTTENTGWCTGDREGQRFCRKCASRRTCAYYWKNREKILARLRQQTIDRREGK